MLFEHGEDESESLQRLTTARGMREDAPRKGSTRLVASPRTRRACIQELQSLQLPWSKQTRNLPVEKDRCRASVSRIEDRLF